MKTLLALAFLSPSLLVGATPFRNLDFEQADLTGVHERFPNYPSFEGDVSSLAPGWSISYQGLTLSKMEYQGPDIYAAASLIGPGIVNGRQFPSRDYPSEGNFSLFFAPYFIDHGSGTGNYDLVQRGEVPADAKSVHFLNYAQGFKLFVNDAEVPLTYTRSDKPLVPGLFPYDVSGDISSFAGREVELKFETYIRGTPPDGDVSYHAIDSIRFSPETVPEPTTLGLLGLGVGWFLVKRRSP